MAGAPEHYDVVLTVGAEQDLEDIHDYILRADCQANADRLLDGIARTVESLSRLPERGSYPKELLALGIKEYRQVMFKPYRLLYRVAEQQVVVYLIVDGRRDMPSVLARRLLGS